jgi:arylsulfatase A-like enzyme
MTARPWRAFGVAFLYMAVCAVLIGVIETVVAKPRVPPSFRELMYGANLHLLLALVSCLLVRVLLWNRSERFFAAGALGFFLAAELAVIPAYWLNLSTFWPPFYTMKGKLATAGAMGGGMLVGILIALLAARRTTPELWIQWARKLPGALGITLASLVVAGNLVAVASMLPRGDSTSVRQDADAIARPDVFIILVDTLRKDHVSFYGYHRPTTPNIDVLLEESYAFTSAYTPSNWTTPSIASLFTGLYPSAHGIVAATYRIPDDAMMLAEHFRSYGYRTAAFVANHTISGSNGYAQGFQTFFPEPAPWWSYHQRTAIENLPSRLSAPGHATLGRTINQQVFSWLREHPTGPRFVYIQYLEPHSSYLPRPEDREAVAPDAPEGPIDPPLFIDYEHRIAEEGCRDWECMSDPPTLTAEELAGMVANYDGDVHLADHYVGSLLAELQRQGVLDHAHLIFCADHGEEFFEHGGWFHGCSIYEEMTGCPLGYRPPGGLAEGVVVDRPVNLLDIVPTLCERIGLDTPPFHQGVAIPELLGQRRPSRPVPVLTELPDHLFSIRWKQWKLIQRGSPQHPQWLLFDLDRDRAEQRDLATTYPDTLELLKGYLEGLVAQYGQSALTGVTATADPELLERLRTLGYVK